jgi:putative transposase
MDDIRLALNQNQPLGNERFYAKIEKMVGIRREAKPRGRPRLEADAKQSELEGQGKLAL